MGSPQGFSVIHQQPWLLDLIECFVLTNLNLVRMFLMETCALHSAEARNLQPCFMGLVCCVPPSPCAPGPRGAGAPLSGC